MFLLSKLLETSIRTGHLNVIDARGARHEFGDGQSPSVTMRLHDEKLYRSLVLNTELAAGEGYMEGTITFEEGSTLRDMLELYHRNSMRFSSHPLARLQYRSQHALRWLQQSNRLDEAQGNVSHHYDIGNDFYRLFLDRNMIYSCAYFTHEDESLEQAQQNKLALVAAKANLSGGQRVLDVGSGWGDLALFMARSADVHVTGVTLSREQCEYSNERAQKEGLANRVRFKLADYRTLDTSFDRIVSVGMFEHVGVRHYREFFAKISGLLSEDGMMVLHSIGRKDPPTYTSAWVRKYIFPGGYTPSLSEVFRVVEKSGLWVGDVEILRLHYARTLHHWYERFMANRDKVVEMFDERFARMWEFYLVGAESGFVHGGNMVFQMQLARKVDAVPLRRDYVMDRFRELT